jgi:2,4-dienoyl-CoA reductase-like NADH-dependent reductase (Old Yellow Enzyme family)
MRMSDSLFQPGMIGAIPVANRIAMAPLTRARAGMDGVHTPLAIDTIVSARRQASSSPRPLTSRGKVGAMPTHPGSTRMRM